MDNDLMARRLRPPSEPTQSTTLQPPTAGPPTVPWEVTPPPQLQPPSEMQMQPTPQVQPIPEPEPVHQSENVPPWDLAPVEPTEPSQPADTAQPTAELPAWPPVAASADEATTPEAPSMPWASESREEVPWDRPDDYDQPTDTAAPDEQTTWDKPPDEAWVEPNPEWPPVANAVSQQQAVESADPYDAYAPVLGDVAPTMSLAWPETNGHHTELNGSAHTEWADAAPEWVAPQTEASASAAAPEAEATEPATDWFAPESTVSNGSEPDPSAPEAEWFAPEPAASEQEAAAPEPSFEVPEMPVPATPASYAEHQMGPTPPDDLFFAAATTAAVAEAPAEELEPVPEVETEPQAEAEHVDADAWLDETSAWPFEAPADVVSDPEFPPAPDVPMPPPLTGDVAQSMEAVEAEAPVEMFGEDETPAEVSEAAAPEMADEPVATDAETAAPEAPAPEGPASPVVLRIELAIVDGQLQVVNSSEPINVTAGSAELDPRSNETPVIEQEAAATVPLAPLAAATEQVPWSDDVEPTTIPAATPDVPWAVDPVPDATPASPAPWAQNQPSMDPLAAIPAQQAPAASAQHDFTPQAVVASSIFAPPLQPYASEPFAPEQVEPTPFVDMTPAAATAAATAAAPAAAPAAAQNQNDLWFLSTEPEDIDAVTADEDVVVPKESSSVLTAVLTIGMAILVIVLVLVFFSLMTSLLG